MDNIIPSDEYVEFENRVYSNPQVGLDESLAFIDNLRTTQGQQNQEIVQQTENLGTDISSNLGGLTGGEGYFTSRFQTPQTSSAVSNLRAAAQATALNQVLANEQAKWQKRYQNAYNDYQQRAWNANKRSGGGDTDGSTETIIDEDDVVTTEPVGTYDEDRSSVADTIAGKGEHVVTFEVDGNTYYANVYYQEGLAGDRYVSIDASGHGCYEGQHALDFFRDVVARGGKIYNANHQEITPEQALTGWQGIQ